MLTSCICGTVSYLSIKRNKITEYQLPCIFCRYKVGDRGVQQAEPRLELKKHRRQSRKSLNQSILDELDELDDDDDNQIKGFIGNEGR